MVFLVGLDCFNRLGKRGKWVLIDLESWGFREEDERIWVEIMRDSGVVCIGAESTVRKLETSVWSGGLWWGNGRLRVMEEGGLRRWWRETGFLGGFMAFK